MTAVLYLRREAPGRYVHAGESFTLAQASGLIESFASAVVSRFDGSILASDCPARLLAFGRPRYAPDLAQEIYMPDWFCEVCGCEGSADDEYCAHDCEYQGIRVHRSAAADFTIFALENL